MRPGCRRRLLLIPQHGVDFDQLRSGAHGDGRVRVIGDGFVVEDLGGLVVLAILQIIVADLHLALREHLLHLGQALFRGGNIGVTREENHKILEVGDGLFRGGLVIIGPLHQ